MNPFRSIEYLGWLVLLVLAVQIAIIMFPYEEQ